MDKEKYIIVYRRFNTENRDSERDWRIFNEIINRHASNGYECEGNLSQSDSKGFITISQRMVRADENPIVKTKEEIKKIYSKLSDEIFYNRSRINQNDAQEILKRFKDFILGKEEK